MGRSSSCGGPQHDAAQRHGGASRAPGARTRRGRGRSRAPRTRASAHLALHALPSSCAPTPAALRSCSGTSPSLFPPDSLPRSRPLIANQRCRIAELQPDVFFLGAGEVDLKVRREPRSQRRRLLCRRLLLAALPLPLDLPPPGVVALSLPAGCFTRRAVHSPPLPAFRRWASARPSSLRPTRWVMGVLGAGWALGPGLRSVAEHGGAASARPTPATLHSRRRAASWAPDPSARAAAPAACPLFATLQPLVVDCTYEEGEEPASETSSMAG